MDMFCKIGIQISTFYVGVAACLVKAPTNSALIIFSKEFFYERFDHFIIDKKFLLADLSIRSGELCVKMILSTRLFLCIVLAL
jgi:hypothetical protein